MNPQNDGESFRNRLTLNSDNERRKPTKGLVNQRSPKDDDVDLFTFRADPLSNNCHQNGPVATQRVNSSTINACSSHSSNDCVDLGSNAKLEESKQSPALNNIVTNPFDIASTTGRLRNSDNKESVTEDSDQIKYRHKTRHMPGSNDVPSTSGSSNYSGDLGTNIKLKEPRQSLASNAVTNQLDIATTSGRLCDSENKENVIKDSDQIKQRFKTRHDMAGSNEGHSSGSSNLPGNVPKENVPKAESRKRPSTLRLSGLNAEENDSSSDTGNDDYSLGSEDGCIYTYRGGEHLADLPSSFFSLDMGIRRENNLPLRLNYDARAGNQANNIGRASRESSPDMDFLEMDFDPGPSCEVDTEDESSPVRDLDLSNHLPDENSPVVVKVNETNQDVDQAVITQDTENAPKSHNSDNSSQLHNSSVPSTSSGGVGGQVEGPSTSISRGACGQYITHINAQGERLLVKRTTSQIHDDSTPINIHGSSGDLLSPRELLNDEEEDVLIEFSHQINQGDHARTSMELYHLRMAKKLITENSGFTENNDEAQNKKNQQSAHCSKMPQANDESEDVCITETPRSMIWSEKEACEHQVTQIGSSACGATAVINVFLALNIPVDKEKINKAVGTRQRANNAPIPRYLLSRSVAGATAADLVAGIYNASDGLVSARFFPTYPERSMSLSHWLADWISLGAVPILTLNLQAAAGGAGGAAGAAGREVPDAWHHQMVFGVSARGVYVCNPAARMCEAAAWAALAAPSALLVRARDVLARFQPHVDLAPLALAPDPRYRDYNVLGQVVNLLREWRAVNWAENGTRTRYIRIPAAYQAGVTIAALTGSEAHRRLMQASQLPILEPKPPSKPDSVGNDEGPK